MSLPAFRAGHVAIVGRPNVGKSTLVNALVGRKVSIVTAKPQTTRHRILGVVTLPTAQIVLIDTPGLHESTRRVMNQYMNRVAISSSQDADVIVFVIEALRFENDRRMNTFLALGKQLAAAKKWDGAVIAFAASRLSRNIHSTLVSRPRMERPRAWIRPGTIDQPRR